MESVRQTFEEAVSISDFEMAHAAIKDCKERGFEKEAATMEMELKEAMRLSEEDC